MKSRCTKTQDSTQDFIGISLSPFYTKKGRISPFFITLDRLFEKIYECYPKHWFCQPWLP